jgi:hypothetical protein
VDSDKYSFLWLATFVIEITYAFLYYLMDRLLHHADSTVCKALLLSCKGSDRRH